MYLKIQIPELADYAYVAERVHKELTDVFKLKDPQVEVHLVNPTTLLVAWQGPVMTPGQRADVVAVVDKLLAPKPKPAPVAVAKVATKTVAKGKGKN